MRRFVRGLTPYLYLLPHFVFFVTFVMAPIFFGLTISFHDWRILGESRFLGLQNYIKIWHDARFWETVRNTVVFAVISVPAVVVVSLFLALLLRRYFMGRTWALVGIVAPTFFGSAGILMTWSWILDSAPNNVANYYLLRLGVIDKAIGWFDTPSLAWMWIIIVTVWWLCGFGVLLYLGALERIPPEQYESAKIDGAGPWASFWHVTLPWIRNVLLFDVARNVILAFGLFDQVLILTAGGPGGATRTLVYYLYLTGFQRQQFGRAAAVAWYIFVVTALFGVIQLLLLGKSVKAAEE